MTRFKVQFGWRFRRKQHVKKIFGSTTQLMTIEEVIKRYEELIS